MKVSESILGDVGARLGRPPHAFQARAITASLGGQDVMVSAPTGAGKSYVFMGAAWALRAAEGGATVVLYPLKALIRDQARRCRELGLAFAELHGDIRGPEREQELRKVEEGVELVLTTPETLESSSGLKAALDRGGGCSLLVIDEAHVYEAWARSFRGAYRRLGRVATQIGAKRMMLCSATLTSHGAIEAARTLNRLEWELICLPATRKNLNYRAISVPYAGTTLARLVGDPATASGIAYCISPKACETAQADLNRCTGGALSIEAYHGSMGKTERQRVQDAWTTGLSWIIATKAFGMGVDLASVRTILHLELPESLIEYAQQAGRSGRDGKPADCFLNELDHGRSSEWLVDQGHPEPRLAEEAWRYVQRALKPGQWAEFSAGDIAGALGIPDKVGATLSGYLKAEGLVRFRSPRRVWSVRIVEGGADKLEGPRGERKRAFLAAITQAGGSPGPLGFEIAPEALETIAGKVYRDWRGQLDRLALDGVLEVVKPERTAYATLERPDGTVDTSVLARDRALAFERLREMRAFAVMPEEERPKALARAVELEESRLRAGLAELAARAQSAPRCRCGAKPTAQGGFQQCTPCARRAIAAQSS